MARLAVTIRAAAAWLSVLTPPPPQLVSLASQTRASAPADMPNPFTPRLH